MQCLDDILLVGRHKQEVQLVIDKVTAALRGAGFVIGAKSILTPVAEVTWMGKTVNAQAGRIHPRPVAVANCVVRWICMAVAPVTRVSLRRLLGRLVWLGRPSNTTAAFWSGVRMAAFWAVMGAQGATHPCHGRFGGSLLRVAWVGASLYPKHIRPIPQPVCGRCARAGRVLGGYLGTKQAPGSGAARAG